MSIPTYVINLKARTERRAHIIQEFAGRTEFDMQVFEPCEHTVGSIGLWHTLQKIVQDASFAAFDYILVCEDDCAFTNAYIKQALYDGIALAQANNAYILLGGVSWFQDILRVSDNLFWVKKFSGLQFTIIFKKFFQTILNAPFEINAAEDYKICSITTNRFFLHLFISEPPSFQNPPPNYQQ